MLVMPSFSDYLLSKLQDFERQQKRRVSLDAFAEYLGVSRPLVSYWLKGTKPNLENVRLLAAKFGPEVYDVLELSRPDPYLQKINELWDRIPPEKQQKLAEDAERYELMNKGENNATTKQRKATAN
jgi:transcriptional regulator with XRE-family HTH domain